MVFPWRKQALLGDIAIELERRKFDYTLVAEATRATFLVRELEKRDVGGVLAKHKDLKADVLKTLQERVSSFTHVVCLFMLVGLRLLL